MREIAKRFLEDQNFTKEEFEELLKGFENKEERAAFQERLQNDFWKIRILQRKSLKSF